ncbi:MAG: hypothetical protein K2X70_04690 [Candidatus Obscuribacterales bacterium]|jgi:hypothetical protein|nr:hypothetical protein [Candidatus Obscuribacterales bacterium]
MSSNIQAMAKIGPLEIEIIERERPESERYTDANWVITRASCSLHGATVEATGPFIHLTEIKAWRDSLESLYRNLQGEANLSCMEPNVQVRLTGDKKGHIAGSVHITPDPLIQKHEFIFECDQSYLPPLIADLYRILDRFPIRGQHEVNN